ncbi:MAG TPA: O-antigen ligase family protein [Galbitalea sp.]|jgi:O-antigen ligase|nr:O-antigen ligase family protein [Galbitalea sp.]
MARTAPLSGFELAKAMLGSARLTSALTTTIVGTAVFSFALHQLIGWAGYIAILSGLGVIAILSLAAQWREIGWSGLLPISLLGFLGWAGVSIFWSQYHWASLAGISYLVVFALLGIYVALARDTIQIVRTFGNVLRFALALSLAVEILSGLLIDTPIHFLGVTGRIGDLGPITGLVNTTDQLGLVAVVALITFATEMRTKSVQRGVGVGSLVLGAVCLLLSRAPLALGAALVVGAAAAVLYGLRRASDSSRRFWQLGVLVLIVAIAIASWIFRGTIVTTFNATGALTYRLSVWQGVWAFTQSRFLQGWGWVGAWPRDTYPFTTFTAGGHFAGSALNAYLDVWFQLGLVGFAVFLVFLGLALTRSWLLASRRRSVVFAWPSLVLVALVISGLAESSLLVEFGWLSLVVCSVKASRELSWRGAFESVIVLRQTGLEPE